MQIKKDLKRKKPTSPTLDNVRNAMEHLDNVSKMQKTENENDQFGRYIASQLNSLPPIWAVMLRGEIQNIITKVVLESLSGSQSRTSQVFLSLYDRPPSRDASFICFQLSLQTSYSSHKFQPIECITKSFSIIISSFLSITISSPSSSPYPPPLHHHILLSLHHNILLPLHHNILLSLHHYNLPILYITTLSNLPSSDHQTIQFNKTDNIE